jgi:hypothetical protein
MNQVQTEQRRKALRINEDKIRTLEVSEVSDAKRLPDEHPVIPTIFVRANASSGRRPSF